MLMTYADTEKYVKCTSFIFKLTWKYITSSKWISRVTVITVTNRYMLNNGASSMGSARSRAGIATSLRYTS